MKLHGVSAGTREGCIKLAGKTLHCYKNMGEDFKINLYLYITN